MFLTILFLNFVISCEMERCKGSTPITQQTKKCTNKPVTVIEYTTVTSVPEFTTEIDFTTFTEVKTVTSVPEFTTEIDFTILTEFTTITSVPEFTTITSVPEFTTETSIPEPTLQPKTIPVSNGNSATLTYFTDSTTQCYGQNIPSGNAMAINPLLLGFTKQDWIDKFSNTDPGNIPWCGKTMKVTVNGKTFTGTIIDTCDPVGNQFPDPVTGQLIGGKCDYDNVIDLYGETGRTFLQNTVGDDFYQGSLTWEIF